MAEEKLTELQKSVLINNDTWYEKVFPIEVLPTIWHRKFYGEHPLINVLDDAGNYLEKPIKRINEIMNFSDWIDITNNFTFRHSVYGNAVIIVHKVIGNDGKPIIKLNVAQGLVQWSQYLGTNAYVQVIENYRRGTVPVIKITQYGKYEDMVSFSLDKDANYTGEETQSIQDLLMTKKIVKHNNGFIRAIPYINRPDANHFNFGKSDTYGYESLLKGLDILKNKMNDSIEYETTHLEVYLAQGASFGSGDDGEQAKADYLKNEETKQRGTLKIHTSTLESQDGVSSTIVQGNPEQLKPMRNEFLARETEVHMYLGVQFKYNSDGKTNDNEAKVDTMGDSASQESKIRGNKLSGYWSKVWTVVAQFDEQEYWENVDTIDFKINVNDFRNKAMMIEHSKELRSIMPTETLLAKTLGITKHEALALVDRKEEQVKNYITEYLSVSNGNMLSDVDIDVNWATAKVKPETQPIEAEESNGDNTDI